MPEIFVQLWDESERGWGVRPDGVSIHLNQQARDAYIKAYWDRMPDTVPDEYSRPASGTISWGAKEGGGYAYSVSTGVMAVDDATYARVRERLGEKNGLRFWRVEELRKFLEGEDEEGDDG